MAFVGVVLLWLFEEVTDHLVPVFIGMMTFGLGACFGLVYAGNLIFPVANASQTLGFCNTCARFMTIFSGVLVEQSRGIYLGYVATFMFVGTILAGMLDYND